MRNRIENILRQQWPQLFPGRQEPKSLQYLLRGGFRKDLVVIFADHATTPIGIGYYTSEDRIIARLKRQLETLSTIHKSEHNPVKRTVPRPLLFERIDDNMFLFLENLPGKPLEHFLKANTSDLKMVSHWLNLTKNWLRELNTRFLNKRITIEELVSQQSDGLNLKEFMSTCKDHKVPLVLRHGDLQPSNILLEENKIACVDWEYSKNEGAPLYDLFYFLVALYKRCHPHKKEIRSFSSTIDSPEKNIRVPNIDDLKTTFFTKTAFSDVYRETILSLCRDLSIDPIAIKTLFYLFVVEFKGRKTAEELLKNQNSFIVN